MPTQSPFERIEHLKAELAKLQTDALEELRAKRQRLADELAAVDAQLAELTGQPMAGSVRKASKGAARTVVSLEELTAVLESAPDRMVNIRKRGYDLATVKALIEAHPGKLKFVPAGPWPSVALR